MTRPLINPYMPRTRKTLFLRAIGVGRIFSWEDQNWWNLIFTPETKKTIFFAKYVIGKCQNSKSRGLWLPLTPLPTTMLIALFPPPAILTMVATESMLSLSCKILAHKATWWMLQWNVEQSTLFSFSAPISPSLRQPLQWRHQLQNKLILRNQCVDQLRW